MPQIDIFNRTFLRGLQTTRDSDGAMEFAGFQQFHNNRVGKDEAERRPGRTMVADITGFQQSSFFDGISDILGGGLPPAFDLNDDYCLEFLVSPLSLSSGSVIVFGMNGAMILQPTLGTSWELKGVYGGGGGFGVTLPAAGIGFVEHLAIVKVGSSLTLVVDGTASAPIALTGSIAAPTQWLSTFDVLYGNFFSGAIDFWRYSKVAPSTWEGRDRRLFDPRADNVMADYVGAPGSSGILLDRSRYEMHLGTYPTATTPGTSASIGPAHQPVQGMEIFTDEFDRPKLFMVAGGREFQGDF